jgi:hypothetical protein
MRSVVFAMIAAGMVSCSSLARAGDIYLYPPARPLSAPRGYYRTYNAPLPTYRFQPSYRPYMQNGIQVSGYTWGFAWRGGY